MMGLFARWSEKRYGAMIRRHVDKAGCHVTKVYDPAGKQVSFAYSSGFAASLGQAEVIIIGLPGDVAHEVINHLHALCLNDGLVLAEGVRIPDLLQGADLIVRAVVPGAITPDHFRDAMWYHQEVLGRPLRQAFQLVWPSPEPLAYPWEAEYPDALRPFQPALYDTTTPFQTSVH